ncbi:MAG: Crp/Fnr family transcriptional regulator [Clostridia bacterium]|nr:Crp/Fnr family transcriptional regulator [Clostridia bacterium]
MDIKSCPLFEGLKKDELERALTFLRAKEERFPSGRQLNRCGEPIAFFGFVLEGRVEVYTDDIDGNRMLMASVGPGGSFGESLAYLGSDASVYIVSLGARVLTMSAVGLRLPGDSFEQMLAHRFTSMLARRALDMNERIQILSKHTLRAKIETYFAFASAGRESFKLNLNRESMALYLGADRSALSRELSRMKREGVIDFDKNSFTLLKR